MVMTLKEYENLIVNTDETDWTEIGYGPLYLNEFGVWTKGSGEFDNIEIHSHHSYMSLKKNLLVSVAWGLKQNDNFQEDWANKPLNSRASSGLVDFFYSGILVYRDIYVAVDGGRALLPLPKTYRNSQTYQIERLTVSEKRYTFFRLLNGVFISSYDRYVKDAGIEVVENEEWMEGDGY